MGPDLDMVVFDAIRNLDIKPTLVVEGGAHGADRHARQAARLMGIPVKTFPADWTKHGKRAGGVRNQQMLDTGPELVIAFYPSTGITPGTADMIRRAMAAGVPVQHVVYEEKQ